MVWEGKSDKGRGLGDLALVGLEAQCWYQSLFKGPGQGFRGGVPSGRRTILAWKRAGKMSYFCLDPYMSLEGANPHWGSAEG